MFRAGQKLVSEQGSEPEQPGDVAFIIVRQDLVTRVKVTVCPGLTVAATGGKREGVGIAGAGSRSHGVGDSKYDEDD